MRSTHKPTDLTQAHVVEPIRAQDLAVPNGRGNRAAYPREHAGRRPLRWPLVLTRMLIDATLVNLAFVLAYYARYQLQLFRDVQPESILPLAAFIPIEIGLVLGTIAVFYFKGMYAQPRGASWVDQMGKVAGGTLTSVAILIMGSLLTSPVLSSRLLFLFFYVATLLVFGVERFAIKRMRMMLWKRGINIRRVLVVGSGYAGQRIMKDLMERPDLGYTLHGYVEDEADDVAWTVPMNGHGYPARLGQVADVDQVIGAGHIDEVIVALPATGHSRIAEVIERCQRHRVSFRLIPDLFEIRFNQVQIDALNGIPLIGLKEVALQGGNLWLKRTLDVVLAMLFLTVTSPMLAVVALLIKLERPHGPIFFKQERVGLGGLRFMCYKFRSMRPDAEQMKAALLALNEATGPIFKMKNDPRVTRVGKWLRRTSLDELPQVFNILAGHMSWVGPRPPVPSEVEQYSDWHRRRLEITPGLTGLWQVSGRSDISFDDMVKLDLFYAENWSLAFDLKIILMTIPAVLKGEGAY
ncbi:MAG TPA: sugar transferase [Chloroflexia bacterium]|nr:sugar transferase [Chloroflexia bacterium]